MREHIVRVRLNDIELSQLHQEAEKRGVSAAEVLRDYVKKLPRTKKDESTG